jgi:hypothetical protein
MGKVTYTVTITKTEHDVPYTDESWRQLVNEPDEKHENIYGYVKSERTKDVDAQIFKQTLEDIDLAKVVLTLNTPAAPNQE